MRILLVALGLTMAFAHSALAVPVDPSAPNGIAAQIVRVTGASPEGCFRWVLCGDGTIYEFTGSMYSSVPGQWRVFDRPLPVAVSEIADWSLEVLHTRSGGIWIWLSMDGQPATWMEWGVAPMLLPAPCESGVGASGTSLGKIKSLFR